MQDVKPDPFDDPLKALSHALEESRRLRENLQYMPAAIGVSSPAQESTEQVEEALPASF